MCYILATNELKSYHIDILLGEWNSNPHGAGVAWHEPGDKKNPLHVHKGIMTKKEFRKELRSHIGETVVAHVRYATNGEVSPENCHPFSTCGGDALLFHNGVLPAPWSSSRNVSDTRMLATTLDSLSVAEVLKDSRRIAGTIGYNKLVLFSNTGIFHVFNDHYGEWLVEGQTWVSKASYRPYQRAVVQGPAKHYTGTQHGLFINARGEVQRQTSAYLDPDFDDLQKAISRELKEDEGRYIA